MERRQAGACPCPRTDIVARFYPFLAAVPEIIRAGALKRADGFSRRGRSAAAEDLIRL